jgi:hypothetical protein
MSPFIIVKLLISAIGAMIYTIRKNSTTPLAKINPVF